MIQSGSSGPPSANSDRIVAAGSAPSSASATPGAWYRNLDRNWELTADLGRTIDVPALFVAGTADSVLTFTRTDRFAEVVSGPYRQVLIPDAGHWVQQERPDEVNAALLGFLDTIHGRTS